MDYKSTITEFEVQSFVYQHLQQRLPANHIVRGEYKFSKKSLRSSSTGALPGCRPDISIFYHAPDGPQLLCVIEIKKTQDGESTKQGQRYSQLLNVPCIYIRGMEMAKHAFDLVHPYLRF